MALRPLRWFGRAALRQEESSPACGSCGGTPKPALRVAASPEARHHCGEMVDKRLNEGASAMWTARVVCVSDQGQGGRSRGTLHAAIEEAGATPRAVSGAALRGTG
jgi:hypothetical protein